MKKLLLMVMTVLAVSLNMDAQIARNSSDESYSLDDLKSSDMKKGFLLGLGYGKYSLADESSTSWSINGTYFKDVVKNMPLSLGVYYNIGLGDLELPGCKNTKIMSISVPLHIGYRYQPNPMKAFCVSLSGGPYADYQMLYGESSSSKTKISLSDVEGYKKFTFGISGRLNIYMSSLFNLYFEAGTGLTERIKGEKDSFWQVGYFSQF